MNTQQKWSLPAEDLHMGTSLRFDLVDSNGQLIHKAGTTIDERLLSLLHDRSIHSLTLHEAHSEKSATPESVLLGCFPEETIRSIHGSFLNAQTSLFRLLASLHENDEKQLEQVSTSIGEFLAQVKTDIAASLAAISLNSATPSPKVVENIASHSANMAMLSIAMSSVQKDEPVVSYQIGLAALLHDSSLLLNCDWFEREPEARDESSRKKYRRHSIESADLFNGIVGISKPILTMMMEAHEQADGTGYPRGMTIAKVNPGSAILNLADAYLTLTNPVQGQGMVPSDALAYLCFHSTQGKFSKDTLHLLTRCLSMYPIGSTVELDDRSKAVVIKANSNRPMAPVVRLLHPGHLEINLGESKRTISGPFLTGDRRTERLSKARMHEVLWKTDR